MSLDFYVDGILRVHDLTKLRINDRTIVLEGDVGGKYAAATVPIGQECILKQVLNLFAEFQSRKGL